MVVALSGVVLMVGAPGSSSLLGIGASLVMTLAFSVGIVITRHRRDVSMPPSAFRSSSSFSHSARSHSLRA